ncbi:hypothetical protein NVIE_0978 [Nitrososphaera viennensis EN76]|uniref:Uncharacterized protein n=1 Tax=Nitrososphaera viennensis EN76 TaxID=926571 RepID=A0A060HES9_9ARCH|nr:hypothetical protein NVIE_0978 [Nitrososphaera viennensis EN76]
MAIGSISFVFIFFKPLSKKDVQVLVLSLDGRVEAAARNPKEGFEIVYKQQPYERKQEKRYCHRGSQDLQTYASQGGSVAA